MFEATFLLLKCAQADRAIENSGTSKLCDPLLSPINHIEYLEAVQNCVLGLIINTTWDVLRNSKLPLYLAWSKLLSETWVICEV